MEDAGQSVATADRSARGFKGGHTLALIHINMQFILVNNLSVCSASSLSSISSTKKGCVNVKAEHADSELILLSEAADCSHGRSRGASWSKRTRKKKKTKNWGCLF